MAATPLLTVTGRYTAPDQETPASGHVELALTAPLPVLGDRTYDTQTITAPLDDDGNITADDGGPLTLVPSDPAGSLVDPPGVAYRITLRFAGDRSRTWEAFLPANSPGGTVDLTTLVPATAPPLIAPASQHGLNAEITRAETAEEALAAGIAAETLRAEDALAAEAAAAEAAEEALAADIAAETLRAEGAELDLADTVAAQPVVDLVDGAPTLVTAAGLDLDTGDPYTDPLAIPDTDGVIITPLGDVVLVSRVETPLATVDLVDQADAATLDAAETYTDAELGIHTAAVDPHPQYALDTDLPALQARSEKGQPGGYASLDGAGTIPAAQMPALAIGDTFVVHSQAAMLALVAQRGDVAVRDDIDPAGPITFRLVADDPTVLANWVRLNYPGDVVTVNGRSGAVSGLAEAVDLAATNVALAAEVARAEGVEASLPTFDDVLVYALIFGGS